MGRFLSQKDLNEIRRGVAVANSKARRAGVVPQLPQITVFSCKCNCFHTDVCRTVEEHNQIYWKLKST